MTEITFDDSPYLKFRQKLKLANRHVTLMEQQTFAKRRFNIIIDVFIPSI